MSNKEFIKRVEETNLELFTKVEEVFNEATNPIEVAEVIEGVLETYHNASHKFTKLIDAKYSNVYGMIKRLNIDICQLNKPEVIKDIIEDSKQLIAIGTALTACDKFNVSEDYLIEKLSDKQDYMELLILVEELNHNAENSLSKFQTLNSNRDNIIEVPYRVDDRIKYIASICDEFENVIIPNTKNLKKNKTVNSVYNKVKKIKMKYGKGDNPAIYTQYDEQEIINDYCITNKAVAPLIELYKLTSGLGFNILDGDKLEKIAKATLKK